MGCDALPLLLSLVDLTCLRPPSTSRDPNPAPCAVLDGGGGGGGGGLQGLVLDVSPLEWANQDEFPSAAQAMAAAAAAGQPPPVWLALDEVTDPVSSSGAVRLDRRGHRRGHRGLCRPCALCRRGLMRGVPCMRGVGLRGCWPGCTSSLACTRAYRQPTATPSRTTPRAHCRLLQSPPLSRPPACAHTATHHSKTWAPWCARRTASALPACWRARATARRCRPPSARPARGRWRWCSCTRAATCHARCWTRGRRAGPCSARPRGATLCPARPSPSTAQPSSSSVRHRHQMAAETETLVVCGASWRQRRGGQCRAG